MLVTVCDKHTKEDIMEILEKRQNLEDVRSLTRQLVYVDQIAQFHRRVALREY
jgi:nitrate reductase NapAB chaperone NapD